MDSVSNETLSITDERLTQMMQVLGDPTCMQIIRYLGQNPACFMDDLVERLCLTHERVSHDLTALCKAGWIFATTDGQRTCYDLHRDNVLWFKDQIKRRF